MKNDSVIHYQFGLRTSFESSTPHSVRESREDSNSPRWWTGEDVLERTGSWNGWGVLFKQDAVIDVTVRCESVSRLHNQTVII